MNNELTRPVSSADDLALAERLAFWYPEREESVEAAAAISRLVSERDALAGRVKQLEADAERHRFVISHDDYGVCLWHTPPGHQVPGWFMVTAKELDAALNASKEQP